MVGWPQIIAKKDNKVSTHGSRRIGEEGALDAENVASCRKCCWCQTGRREREGLENFEEEDEASSQRRKK